MQIKSMLLKNFRNYNEQSFLFDRGVNIIYGENAQGKTNLLESIYLLSAARSFRTSQKKEMIAFDHDNCSLLADVFSREREFKIKAEIYNDFPAFFSVNGVKCRRNYEVSAVFNSVLFRPEDLELIKGGAEQRRRFMDSALCQLRPSYAEALSSYNKYLVNKQKILRDGENKHSLYDALDSFSAGMAKNGAVLIKRRSEFSQWIKKYAPDIHNEISNGREKLEFIYKTVTGVEDTSAPLIDIQDRLYSRMLELKKREIDAKQCLSGPHKDELEIYINSEYARSYASQGQTRTAALSLKLAERQIFFEDAGEYPILMLDDVLSELDTRRQDFVINRISGGQVFITCCEHEKIKQSLSGKAFYIENGKITV